jgi:D-glycero-D-manno-heptose 1,7-bisphosphate phosphatase
LGGEVMGVFYCPHAPNDHCACRKPKPGLFSQIADRLHVELTDVAAVGDSLRDIQATRRAGAKPILVRTGKGDRTLAAGGLPKDIVVFDDLASVANALINAGH